MEPLPAGANFLRCKMLWEIALDIAGDPATPYHGNRDMTITVGRGSGSSFAPWLRMATGAPHLAFAVARGELDLAVVNPSGLLTQAYRGTGLFNEPLPVRIVANYPSWDRFVMLVHPRTGITSLADLKARRYPLRLSTREDPNHSTRVLISQLLGLHGFGFADLTAWGGSEQLNKGPGDARRLRAIAEESVDAIFDEGLGTWLDTALAAGYRPLELDAAEWARVTALGWRRGTMPAGTFPHLAADHDCVDFSGWPLYSRADLPEADAYRIVAAIHARADEIPWENITGRSPFTGVGPLGVETPATPRDVPLHPGAARWFREHGFEV